MALIIPNRKFTFKGVEWEKVWEGNKTEHFFSEAGKYAFHAILRLPGGFTRNLWLEYDVSSMDYKSLDHVTGVGTIQIAGPVLETESEVGGTVYRNRITVGGRGNLGYRVAAQSGNDREYLEILSVWRVIE